MTLPFTTEQFLDVLAAYNHAFWPVALALWGYALLTAVRLARREASSRFVALMLAVQWAWAGLAYHAMFFTRINPAAWLFSALFLVESGLLAWHGVVHDRLRFTPGRSARHVVAWLLIVYALVYPVLVLADGFSYPAMPAFGVPCPTTLLTIGFLFAADVTAPVPVPVIPVVWAAIAGSAALVFGVRADLMLWAAAFALVCEVLYVRRRRPSGRPSRRAAA